MPRITARSALGLTRRDLLRAAVAGAAGLAGNLLIPRPGQPEEPAGEGYVDAHVHVYPGPVDRYPLKPGARPEKRPLPSFTPEELFRHARPAGVSRAVLIQFSHYGFDNSYILDMRREHAGRFAVVAMVDPQDRPQESLRRVADQGARGLRLGAGSLTPEAWAEDAGIGALWAAAGELGLVVCPLITPVFLPALDTLCRRYPRTRVAIDHMARVGAGGPIQEADLAALCGLSRHAQVHVKVSAFYALGEKRPPYLDLGPMIRRLRESFGASRLLWGSDSPFQILPPHGYADSLELLRTRLDFLTPEDRQCMLRDTAAGLFFG